MNTSLSWIKTYVPDLDVTAQEYTDAMFQLQFEDFNDALVEVLR